MTCRSSGVLRRARIRLIRPLRTGFSADLLCVDLGRDGGAGRGTVIVRDALGDALVRPGRVVVRLVLGQDGAQILLAEDQHAVQYLAAQGADEAFADRVHPRRLDGTAQNPGAGGLEYSVERTGEVLIRGRGSELNVLEPPLAGDHPAGGAPGRV